MTGVHTGDIMWQPTADFIARSNLAQYTAWLQRARGLSFDSYQGLWTWSVGNPEAFWRTIWNYFRIISDRQPETIVSGRMPDARWFEGTKVNYAEHVLRHEHSGDPGRTMIRHSSELRPQADISWRDMSAAVRRLATNLRDRGIGPGDRVVAYMPNVIETVIAMLATAAIGATWSAAAPEFGTKTVIDRFGQISPKLIFAADGYRYGGKDFTRTQEIGEIIDAVPSIETVVWLNYLHSEQEPPNLSRQTRPWQDVMSGPPVAAEDFAFERVPSDHPLWVLFSSGTTGLPKAIVHGHHGILVESYKNAGFHFNIKAGDTLFFYTTTGWMMWNTMMNAPLLNATAVLFDGHPAYPDPLKLFAVAEEAQATTMGINPTLTQIMRKAGLVPKDQFALSHLESLVMAGSPSTPDAFAWAYENVKPDLWVTSQSGGTEFCSGLLGGVPSKPVRAAQIDAPCLGVDARIFDEAGNRIFDAPGELVVASPLPSMPLFLWGDDTGQRYRDAYFDIWPDVWRHGDNAQINSDGGCYVFGRSDATLNRFGVRIGSAEIYATLERIPGIADSLVICIEEADGGYYMPLFLALADGQTLDDTLKKDIVTRLRSERSPRHIPDDIIAVPGIPMTLTGKKMEVPVRKLLMGVAPERAFSRDAMKDPALMDWYIQFAQARAQTRKQASNA